MGLRFLGSGAHPEGRRRSVSAVEQGDRENYRRTRAGLTPSTSSPLQAEQPLLGPIFRDLTWVTECRYTNRLYPTVLTKIVELGRYASE